MSPVVEEAFTIRSLPFESLILLGLQPNIIIDKKRDPVVWGYGFGLRSRLLGYFVRADWAWGIENNMVMPNVFYLSLSLDF